MHHSLLLGKVVPRHGKIIKGSSFKYFVKHLKYRGSSDCWAYSSISNAANFFMWLGYFLIPDDWEGEMFVTNRIIFSLHNTRNYFSTTFTLHVFEESLFWLSVPLCFFQSHFLSALCSEIRHICNTRRLNLKDNVNWGFVGWPGLSCIIYCRK